MIRTITVFQSKLFDKRAREIYGIPTLVLMENAGRSVAEEALKILKNRKEKIAIFCGKGNNGGDGFVCARHLLVKGIKPDIFLTGKIFEVKDEAKINLEILLKLKQKIIEVNEENLNLVGDKISKYDLIIDALLGVGLKGKVRGIFRNLIEMINSSRAYILSIDIPSGLDATTGKILGVCVKAKKTVTFISPKRGMFKDKGPKCCGRIKTVDLGITAF